MRSLLARIRCDSGQAFVFVALALMALVGMAALVIDGGSWYRAQRHLQTAADAAALAGAQELPTKPLTATTVALDYAQRNYAGIPAPTVTFPDPGTIDVAATATAPGIFARIYGSAFDEVDISAQAQARVLAPLSMKNVAPIGVKDTVACIVSDPSCFGPDHTVTVGFNESNIASSLIGLIDLDCRSSSSSGIPSCGSNASGNQLAEWIEDGYADPLPSSQWYGVKPGQTIGPIEAALDDAADDGRILLFPVWDEANADDKSFHVIGWAAFVIDADGVDWGPHTKELTGHFVTFIATDLASGGTISDPDFDFGVHVITLTH